MSGACDKCNEHTLECTCKPYSRCQKNGWISVKDRLPENGQLVLTLKTYLSEYGWTDPSYVIDSGWMKNDRRFDWDKGGKTIYWMPLPEPPKE